VGVPIRASAYTAQAREIAMKRFYGRRLYKVNHGSPGAAPSQPKFSPRMTRMNANLKTQGAAVSQLPRFARLGETDSVGFGVPSLGGPPLIRVNSRDSRAQKSSQDATNLAYSSTDSTVVTRAWNGNEYCGRRNSRNAALLIFMPESSYPRYPCNPRLMP
jgi:hypothetical protein